jgi:hypothetical protein
VDRQVHRRSAAHQRSFNQRGLMCAACSSCTGFLQNPHIGCDVACVCGADKRPVTSPLTGAPMGTGLRPNLHARSMVRNLAATKIHGT